MTTLVAGLLKVDELLCLEFDVSESLRQAGI